MQEFLRFAAGVFEAETAELHEDTAYQEYEKWDSMMHLRLIMEVEERYGIEIPIDDVPNIRTLGQLYRYIENPVSSQE